VLAVERGEPKIVVAAQFGVSRQTLHTWLTRYAQDGLAGLMDRSHRPLRARTRPPLTWRPGCVSYTGNTPVGAPADHPRAGREQLAGRHPAEALATRSSSNSSPEHGFPVPVPRHSHAEPVVPLARP
jgi:winged helix-turn helix protein